MLVVLIFQSHLYLYNYHYFHNIRFLNQVLYIGIPEDVHSPDSKNCRIKYDKKCKRRPDGPNQFKGIGKSHMVKKQVKTDRG